LTNLTFEEGSETTHIGLGAFSRCSITRLVLPMGVINIGPFAFSHCRELTSIELPLGLTSIGSRAFCGCTNLTVLTIPSSVNSIGVSAFSDCPRLEGILTDESNNFFSCEDGVLFDKQKKSVITYPAGKKNSSFEILPNVTHICEAAFSGCGLTTVKIPSTVTSIEKNAFWVCSNLSDILIPLSVISMGENVFADCFKLTIYAEGPSKPIGWDSNWNFLNLPVVWNYIFKTKK
jgi:hypothetical protein